MNKKNGAVLWHCTEGKDRCGLLSATILFLLDVSEDDVMEDYLKTNKAAITRVEKLKKKLASEGLFDVSHKKKLPRIPKKIGVITASTGAAVKDIISTINRRFPLCEIILFPTLVQGVGAKENIVKMIIEANMSDVDVIILGRGGGSIEDLWAFNEEIVARAVYNSDKPIVSAVGHEIDYTICDFVADLRAPTPTGAAELVVPSKLEILKYLGDYQARIKSVINSKLTNYTNVLKKLESNYILKNPLSMYEVEEQKLDNILERLTSLMKYKLDKEVTYLNTLCKNISPNILNKLEKEKTKLETIEAKLNLLNPENILKKGYSLTLIDGKIVKSVKEVSKGAILTTKLSDGNIMSEVTFEDSLLKLENIIRELEKGEVPLDDMVKKYTEAMELVKFCNQKLASATETVNKILTEDGSLTDFKTE